MTNLIHGDARAVLAGMPDWAVAVARNVAQRMAPHLDESSEELHQAAMLEVCRRWPRYSAQRGESSAFIIGAARAGCIDHVRRWRHTRRLGYYGTHEVELPASLSVEPTAERLIEIREARERVTALLAQLPGRLAWLMAALCKGTPQRECARILGVNQSRVSQLKKQALQRLRMLMGELS